MGSCGGGNQSRGLRILELKPPRMQGRVFALVSWGGRGSERGCDVTQWRYRLSQARRVVEVCAGARRVVFGPRRAPGGARRPAGLGLGAARARCARPQPPPPPPPPPAREAGAESAGRAGVGSGLAAPPPPLGHRHRLRASAAWAPSGGAGRGGASELRHGGGAGRGRAADLPCAAPPRAFSGAPPRPAPLGLAPAFIHLS